MGVVSTYRDLLGSGMMQLQQRTNNIIPLQQIYRWNSHWTVSLRQALTLTRKMECHRENS